MVKDAISITTKKNASSVSLQYAPIALIRSLKHVKKNLVFLKDEVLNQLTKKETVKRWALINSKLFITAIYKA
jgi:hypothetical protein